MGMAKSHPTINNLFHPYLLVNLLANKLVTALVIPKAVMNERNAMWDSMPKISLAYWGKILLSTPPFRQQKHLLKPVRKT